MNNIPTQENPVEVEPLEMEIIDNRQEDREEIIWITEANKLHDRYCLFFSTKRVVIADMLSNSEEVISGIAMFLGGSFGLLASTQYDQHCVEKRKKKLLGLHLDEILSYGKFNFEIAYNKITKFQLLKSIGFVGPTLHITTPNKTFRYYMPNRWAFNEYDYYFERVKEYMPNLVEEKKFAEVVDY